MNPDILAEYLDNAPYLKKYRNMTPERAKFIENISQHIKYYMHEMEYNLKNGLKVINEFKESGSEDTEECQIELYQVVKNVEECSTGIQRVLAQNGAPTYYLLHGRVAVFDNGVPIDSFSLHEDLEDDSSSDDSDDDDDDDTERIMRRFGIRPAAQFTFSVTQTGDNVTVSELETVYNNIPSLTQEQVEKMVMAPILKKVPDLIPNVAMPIATPFDSNIISATITSVPDAPVEVQSADTPAVIVQSAVKSDAVKKRGRPKKQAAPDAPAVKADSPAVKADAPAVKADAPAVKADAPKKRGRPKKEPNASV